VAALLDIKAPAGSVVLHTDEYAGLSFGPSSEIQFGDRVGLPDGYAIVSEDEPYLDALLSAYPSVTVVTAEKQTFVCVQCDPNTEWASRAAFNGHTRAKHKLAAVAAE